MIASLVLGVHLATAHFDQTPEVPAAQTQGFNPGIYVITEAGFTAGVLRNSLGRFGAYAGWSLPLGPLDLTLGAVYGYQKKDVYGYDACSAELRRQGATYCVYDLGKSHAVLSPLIGLSYAPRWDWPVRPRITLMPAGVHLSLEKEFQ